jgi:tRNA A37 threonylcarbamoyladenosine synthetase subunit TsaC/SUA5/YrdC
MAPPDIKADAQRVFAVLKAGGIAIVPASMGYTLMTSSDDGMERIFLAKQRPSIKRHAMGGMFDLHTQVHVLTKQNADIVRCIVQDFDLPLGVVAPYDPQHHVIRNIHPRIMEAASVNGTLAMLINAGPISAEISRLATAASLPIMGSSANLSGTGKLYILVQVHYQ